MQIWKPKNTAICIKLEAKRHPLRDTKTGISNPKRYDEHHFII